MYSKHSLFLEAFVAHAAASDTIPWHEQAIVPVKCVTLKRISNVRAILDHVLHTSVVIADSDCVGHGEDSRLNILQV